MPLTSLTIVNAISAAADETYRLCDFLNDLDGWGNGDCDSGSNAARTLKAFVEALSEAHISPQTPLSDTFDVLIEAGITHASGYSGMLLTALFATWRHHLPTHPTTELTPVQARGMLAAMPWDIASPNEAGESTHYVGTRDSADLRERQLHFKANPAVEQLLTDAAADLHDLGATLPAIEELINGFSVSIHAALVDADSTPGGRTDPGAAVLAILVACLDAAVRGDSAMLEDLTQMLADLASRGSDPAPSAQVPDPSQAFTVDLVIEGMEDDAAGYQERLDLLGVRYARVGSCDLFGIGRWRFHIDTAAPLAVYPQRNTIHSFTVADARPDDLIGQDTLSDGVTHRGIRVLERSPRKRVERATVITFTQAPGLIEDIARSGAVVVVNPTPNSRNTVIDIAQASSSGVAVLVPCDSATQRLCLSIQPELERQGCTVLIAQTHNELEALEATRACAPIFVPQPGGREIADLFASVMREALTHVRSASVVVSLDPGPVGQQLPQLLRQVFTHEPQSLRILLSADADDLIAPTIRQLVESQDPGWWPVPVEILDGATQGDTLIQGLLAQGS